MRRRSARQQWVASQSEADFQASVVEAAEALGWLCWHDADSRRNEAGWPDLVLIRERVVYAELKRQDGRIRPAQAAFLEALRAAGAECYVWRPGDMDTVLEVLA